MTRFYQQVRSFLMGLEPQQRFNLGFILIATFAGLVAVYTWSSQVSYRTVLSNRNPAEVMEAVAALGTADIDVVQQDDGSISVPVADHSRALAVISEARIYPDLADITEIGTGVTNEQLYQGLLRQLRGDLARVIEEMDGISRANVMVDVPRRANRLFAQDKGSASVFVDPYPGQRISDDVIEATAHLVAGSVEGLDAESVTVTDNSGVRWGSETDEEAMSMGQIQSRQTAMETALVSKAETPLQRVLGDPSLYAVTASVELTTVSEEIREETFDPEAGAAIKTTAFETESNSSRPGGVPGADASLPERASAASADSENRSEIREDKIMAYPRKTVVRVRPAGELVRQSVSVLVDQSVMMARAEAAGITLEEANAILEKAVGDAVGLDNERGDTLTLQSSPMAPAVSVPEAEADMMATVSPYLPYGIQLIALGLGFVLLRPVVRAITRPRVAPPAAALTPDAPNTAEEDPDLAERLKGMVENFETVDSTQLNNLIENESEASAQVLRLWSKNG